MPRFEDIDWSGSGMTAAEFEPLMRIDADAWDAELSEHREWFDKLGERMPAQFLLKSELLALRLAPPSAPH